MLDKIRRLDRHQGDVARFHNDLRALTSPEQCKLLFRDFIAPFGFDTFACGELDLGDRGRNVFYIIDWPEVWARFYASSGMIERDPIVAALAHYRTPFTWSDLRADRGFAAVGKEALKLAAAAGWTEGLIVPLRQGGSRLGLVSMAGHEPITDLAVRDLLSLAGTCLHNHVRTLVATQGFAEPPVGLTEREIACLRLVVRGAPDAIIALELGIAASTAHEFVEKAKRKLKVRSRAELAALAVGLGIATI